MKGSIQKHVGKTGTSWYAVVDLPADPVTGKRRQKRLSAPTRRECEALVVQTLGEISAGGSGETSKVTVREFLERWTAAIEPTLRPSTFRRYCDLMRLHVIPAIGGVKLGKLAPLDIQRLYADRLEYGLSPTTVNQLHNVLHKALKQAMRWGMVSRNVNEMVDAPRPANPESKTWDAKQVSRVLAQAAGDEFEALWRIALVTGMRRGELLGLTWADVDLDRGVLAVRRSLTRGTGGQWIVGEPKTASGRRQIALPVTAVDSLKAHRRRQNVRRLALGAVWEDRDLVFSNEYGAPLHPNSLALRFKRLVEAAGVPTIRFHDLRHTSATLLLANGEHPKVVAERLGHHDVGVTLNRYSHVTPDMQRGAADRLDAALERAVEKAS